MESIGNSGSTAAAQARRRPDDPSTAAPQRLVNDSVTSSPTTTTTKHDRSPRTEDDLDNDSDQDDPVFDPPLRRVSASAAARSQLVDPPAATATTTTAAAAAGGTGTAFRDGPVKRKKWGGVVWELENKGAVARDHLALERTFLAWLRTSLALASIGIAVTQLFRLPSGTATVPQTPSSSLVDSSPPFSSFLINSLATSSYPPVAALAPVFASQQAQLATLVSQNVSQFSYLAKPIGGTFLALALLFLALGTYRFFHVQAAFVSEPSMFPPSQKTYGFSTFCIGALIVATFAAVLATS